jgi:hypothetical protein
MSDLLDLIFGGALNLDPGGRWRSDPEPPPLPAGIPALPPDARAIARVDDVEGPTAGR